MPTGSFADVLDRPADALVVASELEGEGRHADAIALLTEVNRRRSNPKVERQLVGLRHRAALVGPSRPATGSWPRPAPDRFGPLAAPPEVRGDQLDAELLRSAIVNHGCLIVRDLVPLALVDLLVGDIDQALDAARRHQDGASVHDTLPWWAPFKPADGYNVGGARKWIWEQGSVWAVDSPRALFDLLEVFHELRIDRLVEDYLGEPPALSVKKCTLRRVPADTGTNWHQDGAFLGEGIRTLNVWIALSPCGDDSPSLDVVPTRLDGIVETGTDGALFDWSVGEGAVERVLGGREVVRARFGAGDAMLFDELFLHRTGVSDGMTRDRYTVESWFFARSCYPLEQIPIAL